MVLLPLSNSASPTASCTARRASTGSPAAPGRWAVRSTTTKAPRRGGSRYGRRPSAPITLSTPRSSTKWVSPRWRSWPSGSASARPGWRAPRYTGRAMRSAPGGLSARHGVGLRGLRHQRLAQPGHAGAVGEERQRRVPRRHASASPSASSMRGWPTTSPTYSRASSAGERGPGPTSTVPPPARPVRRRSGETPGSWATRPTVDIGLDR